MVKKAAKTEADVKQEKKVAEHNRPKVSLITCTGGRPECFALLEKHVKAQTFKNYEWLVVDDMQPATICTLGQNYIRGPIDWKPGINTQRANMDLALQHVKGDFIFVLEDDDYYAPQYIASMITALSHSVAAGISNSRYYKVDMPGYKSMKNFHHASLSQTAFRKELLPIMKWAVSSGDFFFDVKFWKTINEQGHPFTLLANSDLSIGMKGMPGRPGLTPGHKENKGFMMDPDFSVLKKWLGTAGFSQYEPFLRKRSVSKEIKPNDGSSGKQVLRSNGGKEIRKLLSGNSSVHGQQSNV